MFPREKIHFQEIIYFCLCADVEQPAARHYFPCYVSPVGRCGAYFLLSEGIRKSGEVLFLFLHWLTKFGQLIESEKFAMSVLLFHTLRSAFFPSFFCFPFFFYS